VFDPKLIKFLETQPISSGRKLYYIANYQDQLSIRGQLSGSIIYNWEALRTQ
jgi:hypothetical protein